MARAVYSGRERHRRILCANLGDFKWGFDGFYVSDWLDIERLETLHKVARNFKEAIYLAVDAGIDMHMHGPNFPELVVELVNEGKLSEQRVNYACSKILEAKFKLGLFENRYVNENNILDKTNVSVNFLIKLQYMLRMVINQGLLFVFWSKLRLFYLL